VRHDPITAWRMDAMQMRFAVAPALSLDGYRRGQRIRFALQRLPSGRLLITRIEPATA